MFINFSFCVINQEPCECIITQPKFPLLRTPNTQYTPGICLNLRNINNDNSNLSYDYLIGIFFKKFCHYCYFFNPFNPLNPRSDSHEISPYNIHKLSRKEVLRIPRLIS